MRILGLFFTSLLISCHGLASYIVPDKGVTPTKFSDSGLPSSEVLNGTLVAATSAGAMTISLKTLANADAAISNPVIINFRNATSATGNYVVGKVTGALSLVLPSGSTLGQVANVAYKTYIYAQNVSGVVQLCASTSSEFDEGTPQVSTSISGTSTSRSTLYCTAGATAPIRLIGRVVSSQASPGTWASSPTEISVRPFSSSTAGSLIGYVKVSGCGSSWVNGSTPYATFSPVSGCTFDAHGDVLYSGTNIPGFKISSVKQGVYVVAASGAFGNNLNGGVSKLSFTDGSVTAPEDSWCVGTGAYGCNSDQYQMIYTAPQSNVTMQFRGSCPVGTGSSTVLADGDKTLTLKVYFYPEVY